jgi:GNAT superfamily N-acetyltransferase
VSELELREEPYDGPGAQVLIAEVQQEYVRRYGGPDRSPVEPDEFAPPRGRFLVGYVDATPVAIGGLRLLDESAVVGHPGEGTVAEVKRMYVVPAARGKGIARRLLARLEELAAELGADRVLLETGHKQPEAIRLYETAGYERIQGFGYYACEPLSVSFGKDVATLPAGR